MDSIVIENISKKYGDQFVLNDVSLSIQQGELFGLLGVNGAGKTTLIHILCGLKNPSSGAITMLGRDGLKELNKIKPDLALSPQETAIAPNLTVRENLAFMARLHGLSKHQADEKVNEMIQTFSFQPYVKQKSKTLSGGWQRKLSIAMALLSEPKILFLDEPTLGLDVLSRRELWQLIEKLKSHMTIILTTHYLEEAEALCDRICIMKDGKIKATGTVDELNKRANETQFEEAFIKFVTEEEL